MRDSISNDRIKMLAPSLISSIEIIDKSMEKSGYKLRVVQGLRTFEEQNELYSQGRTKPGLIVTNASGGNSWHNYALAIDAVPGIIGTDNYSPDWEPLYKSKLKPSWELMFTEARKLGLILGYDWHFQDMPHFQLSKIPVSPTHEDTILLIRKGFKSVWNKYDINID